MNAEKRNELLESLVKLTGNRDEIENEIKKFDAKIEDIETQLAADMIAKEYTSFSHNGVTCRLHHSENILPDKQRSAELWSVMKKKGHGKLFTVHPQTLSATVKKIRTKNDGILPEWLNGLLEITDKYKIKIEREKK